jgi:hypothetical protein
MKIYFCVLRHSDEKEEKDPDEELLKELQARRFLAPLPRKVIISRSKLFCFEIDFWFFC